MKSVWQESIEKNEFSTLNGDAKTKVLIVGGGIAGILTAYFLQKEGVPYILVEKGKICGLTTGNTTAKITYQHGLIYHKILKSYGTDGAKMYLEAGKAAFDEYRKLCENTHCDYEIKDNFVYSIDDEKKLEKEMDALSKIGFNADFFTNLPLPIKTAGAVRFSNQAQFNPLKFLFHIAKGLNIYENTFVREINQNTAITNRGKITAEKIIITTHFPFINRHGSYFLKLYQHRSYVMALKGAQNVGGMYVDDENTGLSFRNYKDMLLLGGGGHRTGKQGGNWEELRRFAKENYPHSKEVCFWAAQDCMSLDDIPYIGNYSKNTPNLYTATGFNKWGMTSSMVSAMILRDMILERDNPFEEIFKPSRSILKPQLLVNGIEAVSNLICISDKRCPHLGCSLKWNKAERTWDCPCHGSRFTEKGTVIENPANKNLS
ncbi:MAG: FAD-dependent oxidoreductase [Clostridia bacterium]|nr:FAD-dependent oxidoreductase [Clostridia bacterium]